MQQSKIPFLFYFALHPPPWDIAQQKLSEQKKEEQHVLLCFSRKQTNQFAVKDGAVYTCSCNVLRGLAKICIQLMLIAAKPDYAEC